MGARAHRLRNALVAVAGPAPRLVALLLAAGVALRVAWALLRPSSGATGEAANVAVAIASGRGFADAYAIGQGATAHLLPISPSIAGAVYALMGVRTLPAEFLLTSWSLVLVFSAFLLLFRTWERLGTPYWGRVGALAVLCLAPTYVVQESVDFRIWEGALASFLIALFVERLTDAEQSASIGKAGLALLGAIAALLFFVNPPFGLGAVLAGMILALRRLKWSEAIFMGAVSATFLITMVAPWTARNAHVLGEPILLRGNAGLELALANHPRALDTRDPRAAFLDRVEAIHPAQSAQAYRRMEQAGGELAYSRMLGEEARVWIMQNKADALLLSLRHVRQVFLPEPWQFASSGSGFAAAPRALVASMVGLIGLLGLGFALARRRWDWLPVAAIIAVPALALALFQPVPRYTYLFYPILAFAAADFLCALVDKVRGSVPRMSGRQGA